MIPRNVMGSQPLMSGNAPAARSAALESSYIQPNLGHGLRIWWAFFWRNTIVAGVLGVLLGAGAVLAAKSLHFALDPRFLVYGGNALEYITAIFIIHYIVQKKFRRFRIILTPADSGDSARILTPVFKRTFRIWWTFTWRSVLYRIALTVAMSVPLGVVSGAFAAISPRIGQVFSWTMGVAISGAVGLFTIYSNILDEDIAGFRVSLAPRTTAVWPEESLPVEPARTEPGTVVP